MRLAAFALLAALAALGTAAAGLALAAPEPQIVHLSVKRFGYSLSEIKIRKGTPLVIEITSQDVPHGFWLPDLDQRTDVEPGKVARIAFTPEKAGRFDYLCDIFCGSGHGEVHGVLIVTD
jgi:cytochrome c oxidase subunit 2